MECKENDKNIKKEEAKRRETYNFRSLYMFWKAVSSMWVMGLPRISNIIKFLGKSSPEIHLMRLLFSELAKEDIKNHI